MNRQSTTAGIVARNYAETLSSSVPSGSSWCSTTPYPAPRTRRPGYTVANARRSCRARQLRPAVPDGHDHGHAPNGGTETLIDGGAAAVIAFLRRRRRIERGSRARRSCSRCCSSRCARVPSAACSTYANTSSDATTALRSARGNDYDAKGAMQAAIATVRTGTDLRDRRHERVHAADHDAQQSDPAPCSGSTASLQSSRRPASATTCSLVCPSSVAAPCTDSPIAP